jgi:hypothetical protein
MAKHMGNLVIPAINFGDDSSQFATIVVNDNQQVSNTNEDLFLHVKVSTTEPYIQQQVIYTLKLNPLGPCALPIKKTIGLALARKNNTSCQAKRGDSRWSTFLWKNSIFTFCDDIIRTLYPAASYLYLKAIS